MDEDVFMMSESMVEIHVPMISSAATHGWVYYGFLACLVTYAYAVVVKHGAIEGDAGLGACADIAHLDVVTKERRLGVRLSDDFKTAHNTQEFGHRRHRRR